MAEALLITRDDLVRFTSVNGNVDTDKFIQYIKIAQDIHIQNYLGTELLSFEGMSSTKFTTEIGFIFSTYLSPSFTLEGPPPQHS